MMVGDKWHDWTVTEISEGGALTLHKPCPQCGCPKGHVFRTVERLLNSVRHSPVKDHKCIAYLRERIEQLEAVALPVR